MKRTGITLAASVVLLLTAAFGVGGCSRSDGGSAAPGMRAEIVTEPQPPVAGQETTFHVSIEYDAALMQEAQVTLYLEMQEMDHGENKLLLQEESPGVYAGKGTFPMPGEWTAHVRAQKGTVTQSANVPLTVKP